ncbi:MAG: hypothetical protein JSR17_08900 [Proteobacteria bacterium]|nr:hypothetical protein [Pseudomonadota bacterium]
MIGNTHSTLDLVMQLPPENLSSYVHLGIYPPASYLAPIDAHLAGTKGEAEKITAYIRANMRGYREDLKNVARRLSIHGHEDPFAFANIAENEYLSRNIEFSDDGVFFHMSGSDYARSSYKGALYTVYERARERKEAKEAKQQKPTFLQPKAWAPSREASVLQPKAWAPSREESVLQPNTNQRPLPPFLGRK